MSTRPAGASAIAARRPAIPLPTIAKSVESATECYPTSRARSMDPVRIDVSTPSRAYAITLGDGVLDRARRVLDDLHLPERRFVVSSPAVWRLHGSRAGNAIAGAEPILVPDGERFKQL